MRILVVDDSRDGAVTSTMLLRTLGHDVSYTHDGQLALTQVLDFKPDLVLIDLGMSPLDGCEIAKRMRQQPQLASCALVAVTGYSDDAHRQRATVAGFVEYLVKPIGLDQLRELLERLSERPSKGPRKSTTAV